MGSTLSSAAGFTIREGDGAVLEGDDAAIGDGDFKDIGGEVFEGGGPIGIGLAMHIPVGMPDLGVDAVEEFGFGHLLFEESPVDGRERFNGNKEVVSGREPLGAVFGAPTARDDIVDVGVILELPAPGMEDAGKAREIGADETLVFGEPFERLGRGLEQGVVGDLLMRADKVAQGLRDRKGDEEVRSGELFLQMVLEP